MTAIEKDSVMFFEKVSSHVCSAIIEEELRNGFTKDEFDEVHRETRDELNIVTDTYYVGHSLWSPVVSLRMDICVGGINVICHGETYDSAFFPFLGFTEKDKANVRKVCRMFVSEVRDWREKRMTDVETFKHRLCKRMLLDMVDSMIAETFPDGLRKILLRDDYGYLDGIEIGPAGKPSLLLDVPLKGNLRTKFCLWECTSGFRTEVARYNRKCRIEFLPLDFTEKDLERARKQIEEFCKLSVENWEKKKC